MTDAASSKRERESGRPAKPAHSVAATARRLGLRQGTSDALSIRRRRRGKGWCYIGLGGAIIRETGTLARLARLAVPPAYKDVRYSADPAAHLQAVGRDAAGRLQYRYHSEWVKVRESCKAWRLVRLGEVLPRIRRSVGRHLAAAAPTREFACAAVVELVVRTAIRPGYERYARLRGTRGAATLLKSNVKVDGKTISLSFRSKGGKTIVKEFVAPQLASAVILLQKLPGRRLFQYGSEAGELRAVTAREVNSFLRGIADEKISLKDFRTLLASAHVLKALAGAAPAGSARHRRKQVKEAVQTAADELANTPTICRRSYVHDTVVEAFEEGALEPISEKLKSKSLVRSAQAVAEIVGRADLTGA